MATPTLDYTVPQGEDFVIQMVYKEGLTTPVAVDLTGWSCRMDIRNPTGTRLATLNSGDITDVDPDTVGDQGDTEHEITLSATGLITINLGRALSLPTAGVIYQQMQLATPVLVFNYDVFLRNTDGKQKKILKGQLTMEKSETLWL